MSLPVSDRLIVMYARKFAKELVGLKKLTLEFL